MQTDGQTDRQTGRQTDRQTDRERETIYLIFRVVWYVGEAVE